MNLNYDDFEERKEKKKSGFLTKLLSVLLVLMLVLGIMDVKGVMPEEIKETINSLSKLRSFEASSITDSLNEIKNKANLLINEITGKKLKEKTVYKIPEVLRKDIRKLDSNIKSMDIEIGYLFGSLKASLGGKEHAVYMENSFEYDYKDNKERYIYKSKLFNKEKIFKSGVNNITDFYKKGLLKDSSSALTEKEWEEFDKLIEKGEYIDKRASRDPYYLEYYNLNKNDNTINFVVDKNINKKDEITLFKVIEEMISFYGNAGSVTIDAKLYTKDAEVKLVYSNGYLYRKSAIITSEKLEGLKDALKLLNLEDEKKVKKNIDEYGSKTDSDTSFSKTFYLEKGNVTFSYNSSSKEYKLQYDN